MRRRSPASRQQADDVICGHIHHAVMRETGSSHYVSCDDWVEGCTAVEHLDGRLAIINGAKQILRADVASARDRMVELISTYR